LKRILRILGFATVIVAILAIALAGAVSAANGSRTQAQDHGDGCICVECPCGDCICGDCVPDPNLEPGPHGLQKGK